MSQQLKEQDWILSAHDKSAVAFFKAFGLNDKQYANRKYSRLLETAPLSKHCKDRLVKEFIAWRLNGSAAYIGRMTYQKRTIHLALTKEKIVLYTKHFMQWFLKYSATLR